MKTDIALVALASFVLAGCVSQPMMVRPGIEYAAYERDRTECAARATQSIPSNTQFGWAPYVGIYSVDTNAGIKRKFFEQCMRSRGYSRHELPMCDGKTISAALKAVRTDAIMKTKIARTGELCWFRDPRTGDTVIFAKSEGG